MNYTAIYRTQAGCVIGERTYHGVNLMKAEDFALGDYLAVDGCRAMAGQPAATITMYTLVEASQLNVEEL